MDFLSQRHDAAIRKELTGIRDSYHHYWDLLAELLQNSRDAITRKKRSGHNGPFFISISIDPASNSIEVFDNGSGINPDLLAEILAPGGGDKGMSDQTDGEVGEKGVGLTYAIFSCNNFTIQTKSSQGDVSSGRVLNAHKWLNKVDGVSRPVYEECAPESIESKKTIKGESFSLDSFTRIKVGAALPPEGDVNIFQMTHPQLRLLLRTRTAVGVTKPLFDDSAKSEFSAYLSVYSIEGLRTEKIDANYIVPHTLVASSSRVTLEAARDAFVTRGDAISRRRFLSGKTVWARAVEQIGEWDVHVYGAMFPDNDALLDLSQTVLGVPVSQQEEAEGSALLQNGIFVGTKGMPTGMKISPKPGAGRYPAYYKRCFFFVESPNLKFDLGRKSLHYRHTSKLQSAVSQLFAQFEDLAPYQGEARSEPGQPQVTPAERRAASQEKWKETTALADLNESSIKYAKHPNSQEAAVAAIFHELVGAGILPAYHTLRTGYSDRYDAHILYVANGRSLQIVAEFKFALESLVRDLSEKQKHFSEIDLLIAWDANVQQLANSKFILEADPHPTYEGGTHILQVPIPGIDAIPVILLRTLLDRRKTQG